MASKPVVVLLRELRERQGLSLREVARDLSLDPAHLSRIERGSKQPSDSVIARAAHYYGVDEERLAVDAGRLPEDIVEILRRNPALVDKLRRDYGTG